MGNGVISLLLQSMSNLVAPRVCRVCGCSLSQGEELICLGCNLDIPRTRLHLDPFNEIHRRLGHHNQVDRAAGWFYYKKSSPYARLLIDAKYSGLQHIDVALGRMCASELMADAFFQGIDLLVPVPMHWRKQIVRGYNQAAEICRGISEATGIPYADALMAERTHGVQSRHTKSQRYTSIDHTMGVRLADRISGKHILIVDDIITTGASMAEAIRAAAEAAPSAISVLSLGLTYRN